MVARYNEVILAGGLCTLVNEAASHAPSESWRPAKSEIEHLAMLGATIHSSCAELRGSMAFDDACFEPFLTSLLARGVSECFVLSTCNRVELYAVAQNKELLLEALSSHCGRPAAELSRMLQKRTGPEVVQHLFSVCSGIDSAVLGETEIVSQIKSGWQIAEDAGSVGPILGNLLRMALETGKRVRSETTISRAVTSVASLAMREASRRAGGLRDKRLIIVGAGAAAMSAVKYLVEHRPAETIVLNRSPKPAKRLASVLGGAAGTLDQLREEIELADVVVTAVGSGLKLVDQALLESCSEKKRIFIDIAMPGNIDRSVDGVRGATLFDIDGLQEECRRNSARRMEALPAARFIVARETARAVQFLRSRSASDCIRALVERGDRAVEHTLCGMEPKLKRFDDDQRAIVREAVRRAIGGLLADPITALKDPIENDSARAAVTRIFSLEGES